jgi:hypothetical protein
VHGARPAAPAAAAAVAVCSSISTPHGRVVVAGLKTRIVARRTFFDTLPAGEEIEALARWSSPLGP